MYNSGSFVDRCEEEALYWLERGSKAGHIPSTDAVAQYRINKNESSDVFSDCVEKFKYCSNKGLPSAMYNLGILYEEGKLKGDGSYVSTLIMPAALKGYPPAMVLYAKHLQIGEKIAGDDVAAFKILNEASKFGYPVAFFELGRCYEKEIGTPLSPTKAERAYCKAESLGYDFGKGEAPQWSCFEKDERLLDKKGECTYYYRWLEKPFED